MLPQGLGPTPLDRPRIGLLTAAGIAALATLAIVTGRGQSFAFDGTTTGWILSLYGVGVYSAVGIMILWRRPAHGIGRLALGLGMAFSLAVLIDAVLRMFTVHGSVQPGVTGWLAGVRDVARGLSQVLPLAAIALGAILLVAWFPDGRPTGRAGRVVHVLLGIVVIAVAFVAVRDPLLRAVGWSIWWDRAFTVATAAAALSVLLAFAIAVIDLGVRYRRSDPVRRAQTRWVVASAALSGVLTIAILVSSTGAFAEIPGLWGFWLVSTMLPVLAIGLAITRYHLYDIDRIVSRSISYALVSAVLFVVFGGLILLLQSLIGGAVARPGKPIDPIVVAASTLVVAALFNPLRIRVQRAVDRRFHRARYDAERTVAGFAGRLRDQLDLPTLTAELRSATVDAVEPSHTAVWITDRR